MVRPRSRCRELRLCCRERWPVGGPGLSLKLWRVRGWWWHPWRGRPLSGRSSLLSDVLLLGSSLREGSELSDSSCSLLPALALLPVLLGRGFELGGVAERNWGRLGGWSFVDKGLSCSLWLRAAARANDEAWPKGRRWRSASCWRVPEAGKRQSVTSRPSSPSAVDGWSREWAVVGSFYPREIF